MAYCVRAKLSPRPLMSSVTTPNSRVSASVLPTETKRKRRFKVNEDVDEMLQNSQLPQPIHSVHIPETIEIYKLQGNQSPNLIETSTNSKRNKGIFLRTSGSFKSQNPKIPNITLSDHG